MTLYYLLKLSHNSKRVQLLSLKQAMQKSYQKKKLTKAPPSILLALLHQYSQKALKVTLKIKAQPFVKLPKKLA